MKKRPAANADAAIVKGLKQALLNEIDGVEFYRMAAGNARREGIRQLFRFLMEEEERHREAILRQLRGVAQGKPFRIERRPASRKELGKYKSPLYTADLVKAGREAEGEVAALSIGMTLEKRAIAQFTALRKKAAGDPRVEKVFADLAEWERDHLDVLARQYGQLREMYWEEARFWPF
ncbi:MAG: ferritin family protein [Deltaproteobacteria bacterium]|nr:ferritin family protein [Deltaproteobacteria bacterium]